MNILWLQDPDNLVYVNAEKDLPMLERRLKLPGLAEAAQTLRQSPTREGLTLKGPRRTSARLFIPDLLYGRHIEMGENIFVFLGEMSECYVLYWSQPILSSAALTQDA